jgi:hypothetical protein
MIIGARRGEIAALRWPHIDLDSGLITVGRSIGQKGGRTWEKDTKTHQRRTLSLDEDTVNILRAHKLRCENRAAGLGLSISRNGFIFSPDPDCRSPMRPDGLTQRYGRLANRLGLETNFHALRHYSATELIASGVDPRTVAGRLGHGGGGATTLRVYSAWVPSSDRSAAGLIAARMPARPLQSGHPDGGVTRPYMRVASAIRAQIGDGLVSGTRLPPIAEIGAQYGVSCGTAQRAVDALKAMGLVDVVRGHRATVL